ncbi:MAG: Bro-N domain-containing protein [Actinobacteria bacterium]|nr:Bro-N domain-containing protein [Actinomycetota bacterium]
MIINTEVRVVTIDGEPWFVAKDVANAVGIADAAQAVRYLDDDERQSINTAGTSLFTGQGTPVTSVINESGLYSLILRSRKPEAKAFKKWVTSVVLPTIRKTGAYVDPSQVTPVTFLLVGCQVFRTYLYMRGLAGERTHASGYVRTPESPAGL